MPRAQLDAVEYARGPAAGDHARMQGQVMYDMRGVRALTSLEARQRSDCLVAAQTPDVHGHRVEHGLPGGGTCVHPRRGRSNMLDCRSMLKQQSYYQVVLELACDMGQSGYRRPCSGSTANACFAGAVPRHSFVRVLARQEACQARRSRHSGRPAQQDSRRLTVRAGFGDELLDFILGREPASHAGLFSPAGLRTVTALFAAGCGPCPWLGLRLICGEATLLSCRGGRC